MPKNRDNKTAATSRRRFLTTFALGASAAPLVSLSRTLFADRGENPDSSAASLCYSNKRVLGPADLTYLGAMRVPAQGVDMMFSYGGLTGRKVDGQVRLLMVGSDGNAGDHMYELADTGTYHADPSQAPRMSLVRAWGDIYGGLRKSWYPDGTPRLFPDTRYMGSFHFNEATKLLYWTYSDIYNVRGYEDWCLGATRLDPSGPVALGPWRPAGDGKKGPWRCIRLSQHPITGELLCGSGVMSGNGNSPWGPDLWAGQFPTASTPAGFSAPDLPLQKYLTYYPMVGSINRDGSFQGPLKSSRRPGDYIFESIPDITLTEIDPRKNGGTGSWTSLDALRGSVWIDLPDVHGVLFAGNLAAGHVWYRNAGGGNANCTHGQPSPVDVTGPVATAMYPAMIIYDPRDLDAVRSGGREDYTINPVHFINAESRYGLTTAPLGLTGSPKSLGGCYFDSASRKLYVAAPMADSTIAPTLLNPLVHVFRIS